MMELFEISSVQNVMYDSGYLNGDQPNGELDRPGTAIWIKPVDQRQHIKTLAKIPCNELVDGLYHTETKALGGILLDKPSDIISDWRRQILLDGAMVSKEGNQWSVVGIDTDAYLHDVRERLISYMRSSALANGSDSSEVAQPQLSVTPMYLNS